ncbi:beta strand repeat-containing protein, partial [Thalassolituus oleivorans]|uniref:beta strand repeat-containing protein n=1 Tax=Thalassolituus oleivorans TaxID=187493 RepID=UPI0024097486
MTKNTNTSKNVTTAATGFLPKLKQLAEAIRNANLIAAGIRGSLLGSLIAGQIVMPVAVLAADVVANPNSADNLPQGGEFSNGAAETISGFTKTITQSESRITIKWDSFNIGEDYTVHFAQAAGDVALNQVSGSNSTISTIAGTLTGSEGGTVILLNPLGVIFTETSTVSVGALVAAAASMDNDDFVKFTTHKLGVASYRHSRFQISGSGNVTNDSSLTTSLDGVTTTGGLSATSSILLLGGQVTNTGTINAGVVDLVGAEGATISFGSDVLGIDVTGFLGTTAASSSVVNSGTITASQITLEAYAAADLLASAVNNSGTLEATGIATIDGEIRLVGSVQDASKVASVSNSGSLTATNGASIAIEADKVTLDSGTAISATGTAATDTTQEVLAGMITVTTDNLDVSGASSEYNNLNITGNKALSIDIVDKSGVLDSSAIQVTGVSSVKANDAILNGSDTVSELFSIAADGATVTVNNMDLTSVSAIDAGASASDSVTFVAETDASLVSKNTSTDPDVEGFERVDNALTASNIDFTNINSADLAGGALTGSDGADTFVVNTGGLKANEIAVTGLKTNADGIATINASGNTDGKDKLTSDFDASLTSENNEVS